MEMSGEQTFTLDQISVWRALNDPQVLKSCIQGCETIESEGENAYRIVLVAAVGPVKAKFNGKLLMSEIVPPASYTLTFEGSGGAAGFGRGGATVMLIPFAGGTTLKYTAKAQVGGKLAQIGSRLIDGVATRMAASFFEKFKVVVEGKSPTAIG